MADDGLADLRRHAEATLAVMRELTEQMTALAKAAASQAQAVATDPAKVLAQIRRGAVDAVDLTTAWIGPLRRLSEEQRRFAEQMATWAERHRQFAEEVESWAATQRAFAEHLSAWSEPLLTYSEQVTGAFKGLVQAAIPDPDGR